MENKALLVAIAVLLIGILTVLVVEMNQKSPGEQMADDLGELTEEIGNGIDNRN